MYLIFINGLSIEHIVRESFCIKTYVVLSYRYQFSQSRLLQVTGNFFRFYLKWDANGYLQLFISDDASPTDFIGTKGVDSSIARTPEMGSRAIIHAALAGTKREIHGKFLSSCRIEEESDFVISLEGKRVQDRVWVGETFDLYLLLD